jgi:hypothetical protein
MFSYLLNGASGGADHCFLIDGKYGIGLMCKATVTPLPCFRKGTFTKSIILICINSRGRHTTRDVSVRSNRSRGAVATERALTSAEQQIGQEE